MEHTSDIFYLAPHLDDAVLSGGGHMARAVRDGRHVEVITFFTADPRPDLDSPLVRDLHSRGGTASGAGAQRRAEDAESCRRLGVTFRHVGLPDAMYRTDSSGRALYTTRESLFRESGERELLDSVTATIQSLPASATVVAPLAVGGHVDHRLVRAAAEEARAGDLLHYEDFPYVQRFGAIWRATGNPFAWRRETVRLEEADVVAWIDAVRAHISQTTLMFHGDADMEFKMRRHIRRRGGQRLWRRSR